MVSFTTYIDNQLGSSVFKVRSTIFCDILLLPPFLFYFQIMDVKLTSSLIPYLDKETIEEYSNLNFYSDKGELVKMNPVILAALQSTLVKSLLSDDYEDCCVITEYSKNELNEINKFVLTGKCKLTIDNNV